MNRRETNTIGPDNTVDALPLDRRAFLASGGALVVTLAASGLGPVELAQAASNGTATRPPLTGDQLSSYLTIEADGSVIAYYG
jgi:nicotinate dehydrogenase subunit B